MSAELLAPRSRKRVEIAGTDSSERFSLGVASWTMVKLISTSWRDRPTRRCFLGVRGRSRCQRVGGLSTERPRAIADASVQGIH